MIVSLLPLLLSYFGVSSSSVGVSATVLMTLSSTARAAGVAGPRAKRNEHPPAPATAARRERNPPAMVFLPPGWLDPEHNRSSVRVTGLTHALAFQSGSSRQNAKRVCVEMMRPLNHMGSEIWFMHQERRVDALSSRHGLAQCAHYGRE